MSTVIWAVIWIVIPEVGYQNSIRRPKKVEASSKLSGVPNHLGDRWSVGKNRLAVREIEMNATFCEVCKEK